MTFSRHSSSGRLVNLRACAVKGFKVRVQDFRLIVGFEGMDKKLERIILLGGMGEGLL